MTLIHTSRATLCFEQLPEGEDVHVFKGDRLCYYSSKAKRQVYKDLPPGQWDILGMSDNLTDEQCREIVECIDKHFGYYRYYDYDVVDGGNCTIRDPLESWESFKRANNIRVNSLVLKLK